MSDLPIILKLKMFSEAMPSNVNVVIVASLISPDKLIHQKHAFQGSLRADLHMHIYHLMDAKSLAMPCMCQCAIIDTQHK